MSKLTNLENILFLDIETVPEHPSYDTLNAVGQALWEDKTRYRRKDEISAEAFYDQAGIWAEFGKIICISVGFFVGDEKEQSFRVTTFLGDEKELLQDFKHLLSVHFNKARHLLCAHNGKEFDFPYIARRMIINGISLPRQLDLSGKKPWEVPHLDTMEMWKFGDYKHHTSLKLLTYILGIESPKNDIDGAQVRRVFYEEKDIERIARYCERDVVALAQIILRFRQLPLLSEAAIVHVPFSAEN